MYIRKFTFKQLEKSDHFVHFNNKNEEESVENFEISKETLPFFVLPHFSLSQLQKKTWEQQQQKSKSKLS